MIPCITKAQGKKSNPRANLRTLFSTEATILSDCPRKTLAIRIRYLDNKAHTRHLRPGVILIWKTDSSFNMSLH